MKNREKKISKLLDLLTGLNWQNLSKNKSSITGLIDYEFLREYRKLILELVKLEEMTTPKIEKLITITKDLNILLTKSSQDKNHASKIQEISKDIKKIVNDIASENYNIWAETYNILVFYSEVYIWTLEVKRISEFVQKNLNKAGKTVILDVGTGTGTPSLALARLFDNVEIHAFDNAEKMLEEAKRLEKIQQWNLEESTITGLLQKIINKHGSDNPNPQPIHFYHSPVVTLPKNSVDIAVMATAIPSYTSYTYELVESIYASLKPGKKAFINFSSMNISRLILLIRDFGFKTAWKKYKAYTNMDVISEVSADKKRVLSMKFNFKSSVCEEILHSVGFKIVRKRSLFPFMYLLLSLSKVAGYTNERRVRSPYMFLPFTDNLFKKMLYQLICSIDSFLSTWQLPTAYEYWYEVEKS